MKTQLLKLILISLVAGLISSNSFAARRTFLTPGLYPTGQSPVAATVQDFNNDGQSDVATANSVDKNVSVLLGNGNGGFLPANTFAVGSGANKIDSADLDEDGNADLVVTDADKSVYIALGHGDGTFAPASTITLSGGPLGIAINDLDGDGILDLAIAIQGSNNNGSVAVLIGVGDGSFAAPVFYSFTPPHAAVAVVATDLNHDGHLDLAVALTHSPGAKNGLAILLGNGDGTFQPAVISLHDNAGDVAAEDFNQDGNKDLALTIGGTANILLGNGDGTLRAPISTDAVASTVATVDMNRDGFPDLVVGGTDTGVLLGNGDGTFGLVTSYGLGNIYANIFAEVGSFNRDRYPDVIAQGSNRSIAVALGTKDGTLQAPTLIHGGIDGFDSGDFDGDGNADLVDGVPLSFLRGLGDGTFAEGVLIADLDARRLIATDFNGDSKLDLLVCPFFQRGIYTLLGNGDGTFQSPQFTDVSSEEVWPVVADFNNDGQTDVALTVVLGTQFSILIGKGDGTFEPEVIYQTPQYPQSPVATDFNLDGNVDLAISHSFDGTVSIYLGLGDGTFSSPLTIMSQGALYLAADDVNRDSLPDLLVGGGNLLNLFLGNGDGTFQPPQSIYPDYGPIKVADLDGDGRLDITVSPENGTIVVLRGNGNGSFGKGVAYPIGGVFSGYFNLIDLNGDARPEAIVSDIDSSLSIMLNISSRR